MEAHLSMFLMESVDMIVEMPNFWPRREASVDLPVPDVPQIMIMTPLSLCSRESASFKLEYTVRAFSTLATTCIKSSLHTTNCCCWGRE